MVIIKQEQRQKNMEHWRKVVDSVVEFYRAELIGKTLEQNKKQHSCLQDSARAYVEYAFTLLAGEQTNLAEDALDHSIRAAEEALRSEDFVRNKYGWDTQEALGQWPTGGKIEIDETDDRFFYVALPDGARIHFRRAYEPTPEEIAGEKLTGAVMTKRWLHYAEWLKTGERPLNLWRQYVDWRRGIYRPEDVSLYDDDPVAKAEIEHTEGPELEIMLELAELGEHDEVLRLYKNYRHALKELPRDAKFNRRAEHVLYVLSTYVVGEESLKPLARGGIDYWHARSLNWTSRVTWMSRWTRLGWAYLRGRYFTGITNSRSLIRELRGY